MPPPSRRLRTLVLTGLIMLAFILYLRSDRHEQDGQFYRSTVDAIRAKGKDGQEGGGVMRPGSMSDSARVEVLGETDADGFKKMEPVGLNPGDKHAVAPDRQFEELKKERVKQKEKETTTLSTTATIAATTTSTGSPTPSTKADVPDIRSLLKGNSEAETELSTILKKGLVVVFSKSRCPYSRRAKLLLTEQYSISPAPHIVELDQHPLGADLQALLGQVTGRRTVPNVLVEGKSVGGSDSVYALHEEGKLIDTLQNIADGKLEVRLKS